MCINTYHSCIDFDYFGSLSSTGLLKTEYFEWSAKPVL